MSRALQLLLLAFPLLFGASCGGGGGSDDPPPPCTLPGVLRALAVQGEASPVSGQAYGAFAADLLLDVAPGGWAVFEGVTDGAGSPNHVFVVQPDGSVLTAFSKGEQVPAPGDGLISDFLLARVNGAGQVLVEVTITGDGGGRDFGLLTAQVVAGAVVSKAVLVYEGQSMAASGVSGNLTDIQEERVWFQADGRTFFGGTTGEPHEAFWVVNLDGSGLDDQVATGDALIDRTVNPAGVVTCLDILAVGVAASGGGYAFAADVGFSSTGLFTGATGNSASIFDVAWSGQDLPGGGEILRVHGGGDLIVYNNGFVTWQAEGSLGALDDVLLYGSAGQSFIELARTADPAPETTSFLGDLHLLRHRQQASIPTFETTLIGASPVSDYAIFVRTTADVLRSIYEGRPAPSDYGQATGFTQDLPGTDLPQRFDVAPDGGFAFAATMANASSGMFWLIPACGTFTLARSGGPAPVTGGDTFGAFQPQAAHTCHEDVVLFRALLTTNGTGVFRQGP